ncbi:MAG: hypothetical protein PWQ29_1145 [Verrucomicrobiota bacterium]|jgi:rubredoxin|nr:hypothetical protein [Verrucomicrobiota bacterium]MDK2963751.1 hypothetical protein [Verrucomicrobiota bacterium]
MRKWQCGNCGYIHDSEEVPEKCPKCGASKEQYRQLSDEAAKLVERSRHSNTLHAHVIDLARQIELVSNDGIADELDPGCVEVFTRCREMAWEMMKLSMTEQAIHMKKGKWG